MPSFSQPLRSRNGCILMSVFALMVLSGPAAGQLTVIGSPDSDVSNATCGVDGASLARSLLQPKQRIESKKVAVQEESHRVSFVGFEKKGGGGQQSIFALSIKKIDSANFWLVIAGMLLFTVIVDRGQWLLERQSADSARAQAILARTNSELVMFGVVAVALFVVTNLIEMDEGLFLQVEYVDILCSLTCILLMGTISCYFLLFNARAASWEAYEAQDLQEGETPSGSSMDAATYKALARRFQTRHNLPDSFVFLVYLKECFMLDCCEVMNVRWYVWLIMMFVSVFFYWLRGLRLAESIPSPSQYLIGALCFKMLIFLVFAGIAWYVSRPYSQLIKCAPQLARELSTPEGKNVDDIVGDSPRNEFLHVLLQYAALANCVLIMMFLMHEIHIIYIKDVSNYWYLSVTPLLLNVFPLLPLSLMRMSYVDAFHNSNHEALDTVLNEIHRLDGDLQYIRMLWKLKGMPRPKLESKELAYKDFKELLLEDQLNLHVNEERAKRLFAAIDLDGSGTVNVDEFVQVLSDTVPEGTALAAQKAAVFVNIS
mmetsp:Transcript_133929/g.244281  ORF Transcript_133929/g.244281 Transcript_133929/m.244281 type:complete len:542 (+) Transcript_133929:79-1704(+)